MKLCSLILQDINFEPDHISPCCNVPNISVPVFPYNGGRIDISSLVQYLEKTIKEIQTDSALCKGCEHLKEVETNIKLEDIHKLAKSIRFKTISLNQHRFLCNCKCVYCTLWMQKSKTAPYSPLAGIQTLHSNGLLAENCFVSWGGGEPTILKDFSQTAKWLYEQGYFQNIHTNAMQESEIIKQMLQEGKCSVNVSLDSGTEETHKKVKNVSAWARVMKTLQAYRANTSNPGSIILKYIIFEETNSLLEIDSFFKICKNLDIKYTQVSLDFREINAETVSNKTKEALKYFCEEGKNNGFIVQPFFIPEKYLP